MAAGKQLITKYTYGDYEEIAFTSRNEMNLAVWDGERTCRLYNYSIEDTVKERVGRFLHFGLAKIWDDQQLLDLKVFVGNQMFRCHALIMASMSDYFKTELTSEAVRSRQMSGEPVTLVLDDTCISPKMFQLLLDMIYKGTDILQKEHALDLIKAATYLQINALVFRCLNTLVKELTESNCMTMWDWAEANNVPTLASKAKGVALSFFQVLRHTEDFLRMPVERLTLMLGHDLLRYRYEDEILEAILDWVEFDVDGRRQHLSELLPYVCFPYLSSRYLNELRKHPLIGLRTDHASYVDEALTYHLASLQPDGRKVQIEMLKRQAHSLKRLMPGMSRVTVLLGGSVVLDEPLTNVVACWMDPSRYRNVAQFSIASLPQSMGLRFASAVWKNDIYVSGGSRSSDTLLVYKPTENAWHKLRAMPQGREDHSMVANDGKLYVLGGRIITSGSFEVTADISQYNIEADVWQQAGQLPVAVEAAPAVLFSDKVYVFGGRTASGDKVGLVQRLDLATGQSQVVGELPQSTEGAKAIVLGKDMVLACPDGTIYTVHEMSRGRRLTHTESHESDDDPLNSLYSLPLKGAEEEEGVKGTSAQAAFKGKKVHWSMLDPVGAEWVPQEEKATSGEPASQSPRGGDGADEKKSPKTPGEEDTKKTSAADSKTEEEEEVDKNNDEKEEERDVKRATKTDARAEQESDQDDEELEKTDMADAGPAEHAPKTSSTKHADDRVVENKRPRGMKHGEDTDEAEGPGSEEEEEDEEEEEMGRNSPKQTASTPLTPAEPDQPLDFLIAKIASMGKRRDFGLFVHKTDVMVVGGQADNGNFLDDILKIHLPTGKVIKTGCKLVIPLSGMQVECTVIHHDFLLQYFDAASCFYGE
ncbi:ectoderm-neural cortex protein 1-like [Babylonia areolata]|uniref:ectoderm-neural cortex protein 1-like n=1 Tax=Babylonia areolata TaxID=304850 RepID=UPI003FCF3095